MRKKQFIEYFLLNNKSGYKTREKHVKKVFPDLLEKIEHYNDKLFINGDNFHFTQKLYNYLYNIRKVPKCDYCKKELHWRNIFTEGYLKNCSVDCKNKSKKRVLRTKKTCLNKYGVDSVLKSKNIMDKKWSTINKKIIKRFNDSGYTVLSSTKNVLKIRHSDGHVFSISRRQGINRLNTNIEISTKLLPLSSSFSNYELELRAFIESLNIDFVCNSRKIIPPKEIDIYIPEYCLGVEFNGLFWHSDLFMPNDYHMNKTISANDKKIELLHVFEDEWISKNNIVKSIIKKRLNILTQFDITNHIVKNVSNDDKRLFLLENNIFGDTYSDIDVGLFMNDKLLTILSIKKENDCFNIVRFGDKNNHNIKNGTTELLNYVIKKYAPKKITYYDDLRFSEKEFLITNNFKKLKIIQPQHYVVSNVIINKKTQKPLKIFDCGGVIYEKTPHQ